MKTTRRFKVLIMNEDRIITNKELVEMDLVEMVTEWYKNEWIDHRDINYSGDLPTIQHVKDGVFEMTADADVFLDSTDCACEELVDPDHSCGSPVIVDGMMYAISGRICKKRSIWNWWKIF